MEGRPRRVARDSRLLVRTLSMARLDRDQCSLAPGLDNMATASLEPRLLGGGKGLGAGWWQGWGVFTRRWVKRWVKGGGRRKKWDYYLRKSQTSPCGLMHSSISTVVVTSDSLKALKYGCESLKFEPHMGNWISN